jgi:predicted permease
MTVANRVNMSVFIPALIFSVMASKNFHLLQYQSLIIASAVVVMGSGLIVWPICRIFGISVKTLLPPMMFNNSGNLGIPLMVLAFGESVLPIAVILFLTENLLHFTLGMYLVNPKTKLMAIVKMPMVMATFFGVFWSLMGWSLPTAVYIPIEMLGQISIPLMLFALGVRMTQVDLGHWRIGVLGGVLCPLSGLVVALIWQWFSPLPSQEFAYLLIFACLPPAVLNYMVAELYQQEPHKVASIVLVGNLLSLIVVPIVLIFVL